MKKIKLDTSSGKESSTMENTTIKVKDHNKVEKEDVLSQTIKTGDHEKLDELLSSGKSIEAENLRQTFPGSVEYSGALHVAAVSGYVKCVEILIKYGANLEGKDEFGCTALHLASQHGHHPCLKMLLDAGADCCVPIDTSICDTEIPYVKGTTALHLATKFNHMDCVEELIQCGANCDAVDMNGHTSLYIAARDGNSECVLTHLRHARSSSFLSIPCYDASDTPLHFAVKKGMLECVKQLVHLGSDVNHINRQGVSPLHLICFNRFKMDKDIRMQILKILVLEGHNTDVWNASQKILFQDCDAEVKAFLIAYGANVNIARERDSLTLLEYELVSHRNFRLIKCIVNCLPQLPHLVSLNVVRAVQNASFSSRFVLNYLVALRLLRGSRGMYIRINDSTQVLNLLEDVYPSPSDTVTPPPSDQVSSLGDPRRNRIIELFSGPGHVVPLEEPYLDLAYEHVNDELKKLERVSAGGSVKKKFW